MKFTKAEIEAAAVRAATYPAWRAGHWFDDTAHDDSSVARRRLLEDPADAAAHG